MSDSNRLAIRQRITHTVGMRGLVLAIVLAAAGVASAEPQNDCGDSRLAKLRHYPVKLVSQQAGVRVEIQWKMKIAGHEECGTVDTPWQGSLPRGGYNLIVSVDGEVVEQRGIGVGDGDSKLQVVDVTPRKR